MEKQNFQSVVVMVPLSKEILFLILTKVGVSYSELGSTIVLIELVKVCEESGYVFDKVSVLHRCYDNAMVASPSWS